MVIVRFTERGSLGDMRNIYVLSKESKVVGI